MEPVSIVEGGGAGGSGGDDDAGNAGKSKEGAGTENSSKDADGDSNEAPDPNKYPTCGTKSHPVDVVTGRVFTLPIHDLSLPGPLPFSFVRTYSVTATQEDVGLGWGWAHTLGWHIEVQRRSVLVWNDQGKSVEFPQIPAGASTVGDYGWVLRREAKGYAVDVDDGTVRVFGEARDERGEVFLLTAIEDRNKNRIALAYEKGHLIEVTDAAGRTIKVKNTKEGRIGSLEVRNAETNGQWIAFATYRYDERGDLVQVTDAGGYSWHYEYDDLHRMVTDRDRSGLTFHFKYDAQNRCLEAWGDYGGKPDLSLAEDVPKVLADGKTRAKGVHHCKFDYGEGKYTEVADSTEVSRFFGNRRGTLDKAVAGGAVTSSRYDERGFEVAKTNPMGATTRWVRDARGRVLEEIDPLGRRVVFRRDASGLPVTFADAAGGVTEIHRDARGNVVMLKDPAGGIAQYTYDDRGLVTSVIPPGGAATRYAYDTHGNVVEVVMPNGGVARYAYDRFGQRVSAKDPTGAEVRMAYSARGEVVAIYDAAGGVSRYAYDGEGHLVQFTSPKGHVTRFAWGGFNKLCARTDANGNTVRLAYDREGMLVAVFNERDEIHRFFYDPGGHLVGEQTFDRRRMRYRNDGAGRGVRVESNSGEITELVWDLAGQLVERKLPDGNAETFEYDARGFLVRATNASGEFGFERDALGRVVRETQKVAGEEHWVAVTFDTASNRVGTATSLGHVERVERDALGARVRTWLGQGAPVEHIQDVLAREVQRKLPRGGVIGTVFDPVGRVEQRFARSPVASRPVAPGEPEWLGSRDDGVTASLSYSYDPDGEIVSKADRTRGITRYEYDPIGQLLAVVPEKAQAEVFRFDARGNVEEAGDGASRRVYGAGNRLERKGDTEYLWDADGRLVERSERTPSGTKQWKYEWDGAGMLAAVVMPEGRRVEYAYDPFARRVEKRVKGRDGTAWKTLRRTRFVLDGNVLAHEVEHDASAAGDPIVAEKTYWFEDLEFSHVAHRAGGEWFHYVNGPGGTPDQLVDERGEVAGVLDWSAWGHAEAAPGSRATTPLRYPGQYEDSDVGLSYNRARYYAPDLARYISPDPIGLRGGTNELRYPKNPLRYQDPLGLAPTPAQEAAGWQGKGNYPGVDKWTTVTLPKGTVVAMGEPGVSGFATTPEAVKACGESRSAIGQGLQIRPHDVHGYRPKQGLYTLDKDTEVAYCASTSANPHGPDGKPYGAGGLPQYYIPGVTNNPATGQANPDPRFHRTGEVPCGP